MHAFELFCSDGGRVSDGNVPGYLGIQIRYKRVER